MKRKNTIVLPPRMTVKLTDARSVLVNNMSECSHPKSIDAYIK